jgi:hypothetical protein
MKGFYDQVCDIIFQEGKFTFMKREGCQEKCPDVVPTLLLDHKRGRLNNESDLNHFCFEKLKGYLNPDVYEKLMESEEESIESRNKSIVIDGVNIDAVILKKAYASGFSLVHEMKILKTRLEATTQLYRDEMEMATSLNCLPCKNGVVDIPKPPPMP